MMAVPDPGPLRPEGPWRRWVEELRWLLDGLLGRRRLPPVRSSRIRETRATVDGEIVGLFPATGAARDGAVRVLGAARRRRPGGLGRSRVLAVQRFPNDGGRSAVLARVSPGHEDRALAWLDERTRFESGNIRATVPSADEPRPDSTEVQWGLVPRLIVEPAPGPSDPDLAPPRRTPTIHDDPFTGTGPVLLVLDGGVDPDLWPGKRRGLVSIAGRIERVQELDTVYRFVDTVAAPTGRFVPHGTGIAWVALTRAPQVEIRTIDILGLSEPGSDISAMAVFVALHSSHAEAASVINLSFSTDEGGGPVQEAFRQALGIRLDELSRKRGIVCATGNVDDFGRRSPMAFPARHAAVVAVGATASPDGGPAPYSRFGGRQTGRNDWWLADGGSADEPILTIGGERLFGSSFAAAAVSGCIAQRWDPERESVLEFLERRVEPLPEQADPDLWGRGRVETRMTGQEVRDAYVAGVRRRQNERGLRKSPSETP